MVFNATFNDISAIIMAVSFVGGRNRTTIENNQFAVCHSLRQTLSYDVVSSTPRLSGIQTHNFSGDRHR
jgi:hypothetical protein